MTKHYAIGLLISALLLLGNGCESQQVRPVSECIPDIRVEEKLKPLNAELIQDRSLPPVPRAGNNERMLEWCEACADIANQCNNQITRIRALQP